MQMTKKITSIVLAVLMVVSMMSVMAVSASATEYNAADSLQLKASDLAVGDVILAANPWGTSIAHENYKFIMKGGTYSVGSVDNLQADDVVAPELDSTPIGFYYQDTNVAMWFQDINWNNTYYFPLDAEGNLSNEWHVLAADHENKTITFGGHVPAPATPTLSTWAEVVSAAQTGGEYKLAGDIYYCPTADDLFTFAPATVAADFTLDGDGYGFKAKDTTWGGYYDALFKVNDGVNFNLSNVTYDGSAGYNGSSLVGAVCDSLVIANGKAKVALDGVTTNALRTGTAVLLNDKSSATIKDSAFNNSYLEGDNVVVASGASVTLDNTDATVSCADPEYNVMYTNAQGKITYKKFSSSMLTANGTYKLLSDVAVNARIVYGLLASDVTLDLNGHTLTSNASDFGILLSRAGTASKPKSFVLKNGTFNVMNLDTSDSSTAAVKVQANYNEVTLDNVKVNTNGCGVAITSNNDTLNVQNKAEVNAGDEFAIATNGTNTGHTVNITGGKVTSENIAVYFPSTGTLNISGGTITGDTAVYVKSGTVNVSGGTLKAVGEAKEFTPNGNGANSTGDALVIDNAGYPGGAPAVNISGGTFNSANGEGIASYSANETPVEPALDSSIKYSYETLSGVKTYYKSAFPNTISSNGTYTLYEDVNKSARVNTGILVSNATLDLNGHTFTSTATDYAILLSRAGSAASPKSFTIKNGTFNAKQGIDVINSYNDLTVENVTMNVTDNFAISTNGKYTANNITVKDSDITSDSIAIYKPSNGTLTFENSDVTGKVAVYVKSGEVSIDGGTFTGTGAKADHTYNGSGAVPTGDAVVIDNCGYPGGAPSIAITSGTFVSQNADAVGSYGYGGNAALTEFISGGSFSNEVPVEQCAKGFEPAPLDPATGKYTVQVKENPLDELLKNAAAISDGNQFGLNNDYNVGAILGAQSKDRAAVDAAETSDKGAQEAAEGSDIRFVAALSTDMIQRADDYGFVLAKVGTDKTTANTVFDNLKMGDDRAKTISAKNTYNNICGDERYGDPTDLSTDYKYITCAVNGLDDSSKVAARFYVVIDGKTYYAKYAKDNYAGNFRGITAGLSDLTN